MSGLLFLSSEDFTVARGTKGNILCNSIQGFSLILFYSTQCPHCQQLIPMFKKLPGTIGGCQFGMINISTNKQCVRISKETIAPISYVPYIVLYINGKPFIRYEGDKNLQSLAEFVSEFITRLKSQSNFISTQKSTKLENEIPPYSIAIPYSVVCDDDKGVCYLKYDEAYRKKR